MNRSFNLKFKPIRPPSATGVVVVVRLAVMAVWSPALEAMAVVGTRVVSVFSLMMALVGVPSVTREDGLAVVCDLVVVDSSSVLGVWLDT